MEQPFIFKSLLLLRYYTEIQAQNQSE